MVTMKLDLDGQTIRELLAVSDWYEMSPQQFIAHAVECRLDDVEVIAPNLDCWLGRYIKVDR